MKKALKILGCILLLSLAVIIYISYVIDYNSQEDKKLETKITKHYTPEDKITSINQYGNYYIIKTKSKVIVLNNEYKPVLEEELSKISTTLADQDLVYKTNKLMYEKKVFKKDKIVYEYYDAISGELTGKTELEQQ